MSAPTIAEKLAFLKTRPPSERELACVPQVSHGDYEIGVRRTDDYLEEAQEVFIRSSRSSMGSAGDLIVGMFTAQGDLVNASAGTYLHANIPSIVVKYILQNMADDPGIEDGDIWCTNDALYGGIHNPDLGVLMPVFYKGELVAWTAALSHTTETGAVEPGGMPVGAQSRFEEGMNLPPIKIGRKFHIGRDMLELFSAFGMRAERNVMVDLRARATTADRTRQRLVELCDREGVEFVIGLFRRMLMDAEAGARQRIRSWPDGTWRCATFFDAVGFRPGLVRNCYMTMRKRDDRLVFDFTGTGPETPSSFNAHAQAAVGHLVNFIYEYVFHDLPISNATFEPVDFVFPEGTCLSASPRAATSNSVLVSTGLMSAMHNCVGRAMFPTGQWRQVSASASNAASCVHILSGTTQWGAFFADVIAYGLNTQGQGGRPTMDGMNAYGFCWCAFGRAPDVETMENEFPILIPFSQHWPDSGGQGKFRGGMGTVQLWLVHHVPVLYHIGLGGNTFIQTQQPLFGGYAGPTVPGLRINDGEITELLSTVDGKMAMDFETALAGRLGSLTSEFHCRPPRPADKGRSVTFAFSVGGAGYGDPLDRDPMAVERDLRDKVISEWSGANIYKVVYDAVTGRVKAQETTRLRSEERRARIARGRPYHDFEPGWLRRKPPENILAFYGSWPDAVPSAPIFRP